MKPDLFDLKIAKSIKSQRVSLGKGQKEIAYLLRMTVSYYNKHEKGLKAFTGGQLIIISECLGVSISLLMKD